ncbi:MAG TPA: hypothetical protein VGM11_05620 [Acidobacteriaceae bacterium]
MAEDSPNVDRFIRDHIDSVPHLEALLLLWRKAPTPSCVSQIAEQLYVGHAEASDIAEDLERRGLIARNASGAFFFDTGKDELNHQVHALDSTYRRELIRISGIIHSKASPGIRAFANAFRFRKDKS